MKSVYNFNDAKWIDLLEPTTEEAAEAIAEFNIDPRYMRELLMPSPQHNIEAGPGYIYMVFHFPITKQVPDGADPSKDSLEVDFIVGKNFVITSRFDAIDAIDRFAKKLEVDSILKKEFPGDGRDLIFFGLLKEFMSVLRDQLAYLEDWTRDIEKRIFKGHEKDMVQSLSEATREMLDFKKLILPYREVFKSLEDNGTRFFGERFNFYVKDLMEEFSKLEMRIHNHAEVIKELHETNDSLLSNKQNEVMKTLTAVTLIASLIIGAALFWVSLK